MLKEARAKNNLFLEGKGKTKQKTKHNFGFLIRNHIRKRVE